MIFNGGVIRSMKAENIMDYFIIDPPLIVPFSEMTKIQAKKYFNWYKGQIPSRIAQLTKLITSTNGYENWHCDYSPDSLNDLGIWFMNHVEMISKTEQELSDYDNIPEWLRSIISIETETITNRTYSLCVDIGMYFCQVLIKNIGGVELILSKSKRHDDINFNQPVLVGNKNLEFNPSHIMQILAFGFAKKTKLSNRLRELFDIWKNDLSPI
mgnify:CR=1 FL=1